MRLRISDCSNQINLEFAVESPEQRANALKTVSNLPGGCSTSSGSTRRRRS
jgi:hypothetical protein